MCKFALPILDCGAGLKNVGGVFADMLEDCPWQSHGDGQLPGAQDAPSRVECLSRGWPILDKLVGQLSASLKHTALGHSGRV